MKILIIKDKDKFIDELYNHLPIVGDPLSAERERLKAFFKDYEEDAIEFKAKVSGIHYSIRTAKTLSQHIELKTHPEIKDIKSGDKFQVLVVKSKKPEEKHEDTKGT